MNCKTGTSDQGSALLMAVLLLLVGGIVMGAMMTMTVSNTNQTAFAESYESAYQIAEAGINRTLYQIEAAMSAPQAGAMSISEYVSAAEGSGFQGTVGKGKYSVAVVDPFPNDGLFDLESTGTFGGIDRTITATLRTTEAVKALDYSLFGNYIHFDNHNRVNFGVRLVSSVYSNSSIKIDPGIIIEGPVQAVQFVEPSSSYGGLVATKIEPAAQQGDPDPTNISSAPVEQVQPAPTVWPFPSFNFDEALSVAQAQKRVMAAQEFESLAQAAYDYAKTLQCGGSDDQCNQLVSLPQTYYPSSVNKDFVPVNVIKHYTTTSNGVPRRFIRVPNADMPDTLIEVGSHDGVSEGLDTTYEVIFEGDPLPDNDTVFYLDGDLELSLPGECPVRIEGSLIVDGSVTILGSAEILAWENRNSPWFVPLGESLYQFALTLDQVGPGDGFYDTSTPTSGDCGGLPCPPLFDVRYSRYPAIAANDTFRVVGGAYRDDSGSLTFAQAAGGPVHIEGVVYSVAESHLHRSEFEAAAYAVGSEIADIVHNCQFFSFAYDPEAKDTFGFENRVTGRVQLTVVRYSEQ
ncbi:MAG: hypothetical protein JSU96_06150 [Acidobacteriota bacterium]|nr:MAG: hypothetical protein JSU96_06150 [Acidobacteriota bacterium]